MKQKKSNMKVILMMAVTADGKIAKHETHMADWTSKADKKIFVSETKKAGVIIMGKTTYDTIGRPLPGRLNVVMDLKPDTSLNRPGLLEFTNTEPKQLLRELEQRGFHSVIIGGGATINGLFLSLGLLDELWLTVEPKLFGAGMSLFANVDTALDLNLLEVKHLDENVLQLRYKIVN